MGQSCCKAEENETSTQREDNKVIEVGGADYHNNYLQKNENEVSNALSNNRHEPSQDIAVLIPEDLANQENNTVSGVMVERGVYKFKDKYDDHNDAS